MAKECDVSVLRKFNSTGLLYSSNIKMSKIAKGLDDGSDINKLSIFTLIDEAIYNKIIKCKEFIPNTSRNMNHYKVFEMWLKGESYINIRNSCFDFDSVGLEEQTSLCTIYIREMFYYKLPWAFSSLLSFCENGVVKSITVNLPQYTKYGITNPNVVELCVGSIESRELAILLSNRFENSISKEKQSDITDWIVQMPHQELGKSLGNQFDTYTLIQISKFRSIRRELSNEMSMQQNISCNIAGVAYYDYLELFDTECIKLNTIVLFQQDTNNPYDMYAVKVMSNDETRHLGHIPMQYSEEVFDLLESGIELYGLVEHCSKRRATTRILKA